MYYGALLLPPSKQTKSINEEDMKKFSSTLSSELTYALLNNYSYQEYCQLERSLIPQWLEEKEEKKPSEWVKEDLSWLQIWRIKIMEKKALIDLLSNLSEQLLELDEASNQIEKLMEYGTLSVSVGEILVRLLNETTENATLVAATLDLVHTYLESI